MPSPFPCSPMIRKWLWKKTQTEKKKKCSGGKHSKVRLIGMGAANAAGKKLPMLVIGKSTKPRCFKNVKSLPCSYQSQEKSWMNSFLFDEWVKELRKKFKRENCKVVHIVDKWLAHSIIEGLKAVELVFLPPNTLSKIQRMIQGVIHPPKSKYRRKIIQRLIRAVDMKKKNISQNIIFRCVATVTIRSVWSIIATIKNCFRKLWISKKLEEEAINDQDDLFKNLAAEELEETISGFCEK